MIVILGLGNPGSKYEHNRHNVGFDAVSKAAAFFQVKLKKRCLRLYKQAKIQDKALLILPLTYMNRSGEIIKYFNPEDRFVVVCDNMDLAPGGLRIRQGGGFSGQKGLKNIADNLKRDDFIRIYIGIGRPEEGVSVSDYVISNEPDGPKKEAIDKAIEDASKAIIRLIENSSVEELQRDFNRKGLL